tara:strand:+ start:2822 stop:3010 length:189 start_codon:yes stop_codon:yes gene_type:complete
MTVKLSREMRQQDSFTDINKSAIEAPIEALGVGTNSSKKKAFDPVSSSQTFPSLNSIPQQKI